jgi:hypothetical protein
MAAPGRPAPQASARPIRISCTSEDIQVGRLVALDVDWRSLKSAYGIARQRDRAASPAAQAPAECIRDVAAERIAREVAPHSARRPTVAA